MSSGDPETRKRILEVTRRLMEAGGGSGVRMQDIAAAAGLSRQALYLHFASRTALLLATVQYVDDSQGFNEQMQIVRRSADSRAALDAFIGFWASYVPQIYGLAQALLAARSGDEAAAAAWRDRMSGLRRICAWLVEWLAREGFLAAEWPPDAAADMLWALISVQVWESLIVERGWTADTYVAHLGRVARRTFVVDESDMASLT